MQIITLIICLVVYFFCLYRLGRDDYILIRKNISMEQLFDIGFVALIAGAVFARLTFMFLHPVDNTNAFLQFFSPKTANISLTGIVVGGWVWTYLIGKYRKYPLSRIFDFLCLSLSVILPIGYIVNFFFLKKTELITNSVLTVVYLILAIVLGKLLYPRLMSARLREGTISTIFLLCFSLITLIVSILTKTKGTFLFFTLQDFFLIGICLLSTILLFRQERKGSKGRK